jgi:hypothetical protein
MKPPTPIHVRALVPLFVLGTVLFIPLAYLGRVAFGTDFAFLGLLQVVAGVMVAFNIAGTLDHSRAAGLYRRDHPPRWIVALGMRPSQPRWMLHPVLVRFASVIWIAIGLIWTVSGIGIMAER